MTTAAFSDILGFGLGFVGWGRGLEGHDLGLGGYGLVNITADTNIYSIYWSFLRYLWVMII